MSNHCHPHASEYLASSLITDNIDIWTSAIKKRNATGRGSNKKIELTGIKKLRELILELAVRGKLVPQDPSDEPASVLLEKIAEEKVQLIADKKIKKQKSLPVITDEGKAVLPIGWSNAYMQDITKIVTCGMASTPKYHEEGRIFLSAKNVKPYKFMPAEHKFVDEATYKKITQNAKPEKDDILLTRVGAGIGEAAVIDIDIEFAIYVSLTLIKPFHNHLYSYFLLLWLNSPQGTKKSIDNIYGRGVSAGNLNVNLVRGFVVPIPPLAEQHRIVAKVDELMALCDELEQQTEQSLAAHQTLVEALLAMLTESASTENFQTSWQRISDHFDVLFTTEASIEQLKQTILQLAVMGKLVPQNPNDEPASKLLEKITAEKAQLIKDKKIKKQKPLPEITNEEKPFELPRGWEWCHLQDVSTYIQRGKGPKYDENGLVKVISQKCIQWSGFNLKPARFINNESLDKYQEERFLQSRDLLWNSTGTGTAGRINLLEHVKNKTLVADSHVTVIRTIFIDAAFIKNYITAPGVQYRIEPGNENSLVSGTTNQVELNTSSVTSLEIPIPPIEEQHRIVAKVYELMALCEQLKARLSDAQTTQHHLADAVVDNALS